MNSWRRLVRLLLCLACTCISARASDVLVAAASDLSGAMKEIAANFEKASGHKVKLTLGSSGNFHAQIQNGAPFDVFLSADKQYVDDLERSGLLETGTATTYAIGRIVLWAPRTSPVALETMGLKALADSRIRRIAIANPEHAPYGRAAVAAMKAAGVYEAIQTRLVLGENISQAAQFAQSGAADLGILALSLALAEPLKSQGRYWEVPQELYPRMEQGAAVLRQARKAGHLDAAKAFLAALRSPSGQAALRRFGFSIPGEAQAR